MLSGCGTTDQIRQAEQAAATTATASASTGLPDWPDYCRDKMPGVDPKVGEKARWTIKRWEIVHENDNARTAWCAGFYDDVRASVANPAVSIAPN
ncbi:hypothetical protein F3Y30_11930 [Sinorhizobium sp. BG8]|nr:hypothetical protein F3Y30_11930 [Sinorhizobium sp. BG8]